MRVTPVEAGARGPPWTRPYVPCLCDLLRRPCGIWLGPGSSTPFCLPGPGWSPVLSASPASPPWIGAVLGGLQALLWWGLQGHGPLLAQVSLVLAAGLLLSGGLHMDGAMDTADGLGAGQERLLEAMEDSRVGASGAQALALLLLLRAGALACLGVGAPPVLWSGRRSGGGSPPWWRWRAFPICGGRGRPPFIAATGPAWRGNCRPTPAAPAAAGAAHLRMGAAAGQGFGP